MPARETGGNVESKFVRAAGGRRKERYRIFAVGDINTFFGLMLDNMSGLVIMATILMGAFRMPREINEQ